MMMMMMIIINRQSSGKQNDINIVPTHKQPNQHLTHEDVTVLWNQRIKTDRDVTADWLAVITKNKRGNVHNDCYGLTNGKKDCHAKGRGKILKCEYICSDTSV
jgi:hypothetical protein